MGETSAQHDKTKAPWWAWILVVLFTLYVTFKVNGWLVDLGIRDPSAAWDIAMVTCLPIAGLVAYKCWREGDLWMPRRLVPVVVVLTFGVLVGAYSGSDQHDHGFIADYCKYGSVSQAQLDGCRAHVEDSDIEESGSNAARFARRDMDECLNDSGPFCSEALKHRLLEDQA